MKRLIYTFLPFYKTTLWGGYRIARFKGEAKYAGRIGESWELSAVEGMESVVADGHDAGLTLSRLCQTYGEDLLGPGCPGNVFPLLIKILDADADLSVQVHPDDDLARKRGLPHGKDEMWYVIGAEPQAMIYCGFKRRLSPSSLEAVVAEGRLLDYIGDFHSRPGDCFFIPGGTVHCIGAGNLLIEIQQSSDVTYRIDDFGRRDSEGRLRELHVDLAKDAIVYNPEATCHSRPEALSGQTVPLVECRNFSTSLLSLEEGQQTKFAMPTSFISVICIEGTLHVKADDKEETVLSRGHSALIAATAHNVSFSVPSGIARAVIAHI